MSLYKQKGSDVWHASISLPDRPRLRCTTGETDRVKAQRRHDELKAELWATEPVAALSGATWGKAVELWLDATKRSDSELHSLAKLTRHYPDRPLAAITAESFEKALAFCETASTYTRYATMIEAIARRSGRPIKLAKRREKKTKSRMWLREPQWAKLYAELPAHLKAPAEFSVETGLRQANVLALRWERIDLARKHMYIEAEDAKGGEPIPVPLSKRALQILKAQPRINEFVFNYRDKPMTEIGNAFKKACTRAGVGKFEQWMEDGKLRERYTGFTWHGLRHTWATWHIQRETPLEVLQKLGGWSDLRMVMTYAHHSSKHLARYA